MATHSSVLAWRIPGTWGAWWAAVYGVVQSWTRLKRLSSSSIALGNSQKNGRAVRQRLIEISAFQRVLEGKVTALDDRLQIWEGVKGDS